LIQIVCCVSAAISLLVIKLWLSAVTGLKRVMNRKRYSNKYLVQTDSFSRHRCGFELHTTMKLRLSTSRRGCFRFSNHSNNNADNNSKLVSNSNRCQAVHRWFKSLWKYIFHFLTINLTLLFIVTMHYEQIIK